MILGVWSREKTVKVSNYARWLSCMVEIRRTNGKAYDSSGNNMMVTFLGPTWANWKFRALSFDGGDDYVVTDVTTFSN